MNEEMTLFMEVQALNFHAAYERCLTLPNGIPLIWNEISNSRIPLVIPAYVCVAFSAEIALKALLHREGIKARGHDLEKLSKKLPAKIQRKIKDRAAPYVIDFDAELKAAKDVFTELRYAFEYEGPPKQGSFRVVVAISMAATEMLDLNITITT